MALYYRKTPQIKHKAPTCVVNSLFRRKQTVAEVVNRSLAVLEEAGAIERSGGQIVKLDREKLNGYAGSQ